MPNADKSRKHEVLQNMAMSLMDISSLVVLRRELCAEPLDEGGLAGAGRAGDADPEGVGGAAPRLHQGEELGGLGHVTRVRRLCESDGPGEGLPLAAEEATVQGGSYCKRLC